MHWINNRIICSGDTPPNATRHVLLTLVGVYTGDFWREFSLSLAYVIEQTMHIEEGLTLESLVGKIALVTYYCNNLSLPVSLVFEILIV